MLYTPVKVAVAEDQLARLKSSLKDGSSKTLSIKIQLKSKNNKMPEPHTLLLTRATDSCTDYQDRKSSCNGSSNIQDDSFQ